MAKKIYLADDEQDIREILTEFLSNAGYEVKAGSPLALDNG